MKQEQKVPKVFVALSGGVDSSVAVALLKRRGFDVVGVYMKQWTPSIFDRECPWKREREDAMRVAAHLGIPFETWDFSKEYEKYVAKYMIDSYRKGITPNPDVMCNKIIKFGLFFDKAMERGADFIATGHYASIKKQVSRSKYQGAEFKILQARDKNKDQTYFLWTLNQKVLSKTLFPIGEYLKPEVRKLAEKFGLPTADKKDSQGVCFVGELDMKEFLKNYIKPKKGNVLDLENKVIGQHEGAYYYTIGQRHGLNLGIAGGPFYIIQKDIKKNLIWVGTEINLQTSQAKISNINWINPTKNLTTCDVVKLEVKIRYRTKSEKATLAGDKLHFVKPQRAITSGQSAVFYHGEELLGGGVIN